MRAIFTRSSSRKVKLFIRCCPCSEHALQHALQHAPQHAHETLVEYPTPTSSNLQRLRRPHSQASTKTATHCSWPQWNSLFFVEWFSRAAVNIDGKIITECGWSGPGRSTMWELAEVAPGDMLS